MVLTILVVIIVVILLIDVISGAIAGALGLSSAFGGRLFRLIFGKKVEVTCRCGKKFTAHPNRMRKWIVTCPYCSTKCRVDTRRKTITK